MKKYMRGISALLVVSMLSLTGCGSSGETTTAATEAGTDAAVTTAAATEQEGTTGQATEDTDKDSQVWYFQKGDVRIEMMAPSDPIIEALGEYKSSYEAPSCAFDGMDLVYTYAGFEVLSYDQNGTRLITGVVLRDDTVGTPEGIYIGSDIASVEKVYGEVAEGANNLILTRGNTDLLLIFKDGVVSSIQYLLRNE